MNKTDHTVLKLSEAAKGELEFLNKYDREYIKIANSGLALPDGFMLSPNLFLHFLKENSLVKKINDLLSTIHFERADSLMQVSNHIKKLIYESNLPAKLEAEIANEYKKLGNFFKDAYVLIGDSRHKTIGLPNLITDVKKYWSSQFEPRYLLRAHQRKIDLFENLAPVIIKKHVDYKKTGKLSTSNLSIQTDFKLSPSEQKKIEEIGKKLKKLFYIPQIVSWGINNKKVYVLDSQLMTNAQKSYLVLVRHGRSEYNEKGLWAGWDEPPLTKNGEEDVRIAARTLKNIHFDIAYASHLIRHKQTVDVLKETLNRADLPVIINDALLERDYGDLTGKNKWDIKKEFGEKQFMKWRRSWADPVPNGESLKQVYERIVPYYKKTILPQLKAGKNVVVASSGNSLRALVKYLENISDEGVTKLEIATGEVYVYQIDEDGNVVSKEIRNQHENKV